MLFNLAFGLIAISGDAFLHLGEVALRAGQSTSLASSRLVRPLGRVDLGTPTSHYMSALLT